MHKIRFTALTICFLLFNYISAQTIKIEQGVAVSSLDGYNVSGTDLFDENITPYQIAIGIDYCENKWWNLSSNIGFITKGGKSTVSMLDENGNLIEKAGDVKLRIIMLH